MAKNILTKIRHPSGMASSYGFSSWPGVDAISWYFRYISRARKSVWYLSLKEWWILLITIKTFFRESLLPSSEGFLAIFSQHYFELTLEVPGWGWLGPWVFISGCWQRLGSLMGWIGSFRKAALRYLVMRQLEGNNYKWALPNRIFELPWPILAY